MMSDETPQKKRYTPPVEVKTEAAKTDTDNPVVAYLRLDFLKDGTYAVDSDLPLSLAHAAALSELSRDICNHFHEAAQKAALAKGQIGLPRVDPRLRMN